MPFLDSVAMLSKLDGLLARKFGVGYVDKVMAVVITKEDLDPAELPAFKQAVASRLRSNPDARFRDYATTLHALWSANE
jgi:hypothetical protein